MAISFRCGCGRGFQVRDELAGRKARCPQCQAILRVPEAPVAPPASAFDDDNDDGNPYGLAEDAAPARRAVAEPAVNVYAEARRDAEAAGPRLPRTRFAPTSAGESGASAPSSGGSKGKPVGGRALLEYAYLLLFFALVPLMFSLLGKEEKPNLEQRLADTFAHASPDEQARMASVFGRKDQEVSDAEVFAALPGHRFFGAHLARDSSAHWAYAAIATVAFLLLLCLFFSVERANPLHLLGIGLFTATVGIIFLLLVQFCSNFRMRTFRGGGKGMIILLILMFIGWSYSSANDPGANFLLSAFGFICGVGLCEEFTKAIPLLFAFKRESSMGWRGACLWGLASGIGFGVSEGVMYSSQHYNGIGGGDIYLVRFVSCVALHAMWSASVGIAIARNIHDYEATSDAGGVGLFALRVMAVPMVLHGFYDTFLKMDMNAAALLVALLSFGWLAWHIELARRTNPKPGRARKPRREALAY